MAEGFGFGAGSWVDRLPRDLRLIAGDFNRCPMALARAAERKRAGLCLAGTLFMPHLRALIATNNSAKILADVADHDTREALFIGLASESLEANGVSQREWILFDPAILAAAQAFLATCDVWVARSTTEVQYVSALVNYAADTILLAAPNDPQVPAPSDVRGEKRSEVVVWAPNATREQCAVFAFGLESLRVPVTILCRESGPSLSGLRANFRAAAQSATTLSQACVIVDASFDDPGSARALARFAVPLVAATTSGAHEWLHPLYAYLPWSARSVYDGVLSALGGEPPQPIRDDDGTAAIGSVLDAADRSMRTTGPLVSIVIPTYNRRERLRCALQSASNQRYDALEIIVVNDCGQDVSDVVSAFPRALLVENPRNLGVTPSLNVGVAEARGEYIGFLADDDFLQPDHVPRLVAALERSGLDVAHSKELSIHYDVEPGGREILLGHHIGAPSPTHPSEMLVNNRIGGPCVMVRRRAFITAGQFDADMRHGSDFEMWMRLSRKHDFVFVNHVTAHMSMRNDMSQLSSVSGVQTGAIVKRIYAKHPVVGRQGVEAQRKAALTRLDSQIVLRSAPAKALQADDLQELAMRAGEASAII